MNDVSRPGPRHTRLGPPGFAQARARARGERTGVLVVLRDGALQSGGLDDPIQVRETVRRAVLDLVGPIERA
ncbi:MAG TPA: hypothetical protein VH141_05005 [Pseudonocardia sp.]|nr:hypothetical protein [Pseudonocardia sp.]